MRGRLALGPVASFLLKETSLQVWRVEEKARRRIGWQKRREVGVEVEDEAQKSGLPDWRVNASITSRWHFIATEESANWGRCKQQVDGTKKDNLGRHSMTLRGRERLGVRVTRM